MNFPMPRTTLLQSTLISLAILLSTALFAPAGFAECIDYTRLPHVIGGNQINGDPAAVVVSGDYAYIANKFSGFQVVNISNPTNPQHIATVSTPYASDVVLSASGPYAYVADRYTIKVFDISNPANPTVVGESPVPDGAFHVAVSGSYLYVGNEFYGVRVIDVSNPQAPTFVTALDTPGSASAIAISGSYAYVADASGGVLVLDISDPLQPEIVGGVATPEWALEIAVQGSNAYVINGPWMHVLDISSPTAPVIVATLTNLTPRNVFPTGPYLYVVGDSGLWVLDSSNPAAPVVLGVAQVSSDGGDDVFVMGSHAYVVGVRSGYFHVVDVAHPSFPTVQTLPVGGSLAISGTHVYSVSNNTLSVIDISNPDSPIITGTLSIPNGEIVAQGSYAYVLSSGTLYVIDVSDPSTPTVAGSVSSLGGTKLAVSGLHVYIVWNGIAVVDVSNPAAPVLVGSMVVSGTWQNIAVSGSVAYITGTPGMAIFDCSNPASPTLMTTLNIRGALTISGSNIFVVSSLTYFSIYSLGGTLFGQIAIPGAPNSPPVVSGSFAYFITTDVNGQVLHAIDCSDLNAPHDLGILTAPAGANHLVASESNVYVANASTTGIMPGHCFNRPPFVQNPGTQNGTELTFFSVTVTATDPEDDPVSMSLIGPLPAWATFTDLGGGTALLKGTPQVGQAGTYPISIRSTDGEIADTTSFNIVIAPALATVNLEGSGFVPGTVTIRAGAQVKWIKIAGGNHTTTNGTGPLDPGAGTLWDAELRATSPEFIRVFPTGGTFPYFCRNHPSETGTITVSTAQTGIDEPPSTRFRLVASPNPFRAGVDLQFDLERAAHVSVVIVDLQGRKVRELVTAEFPAGTRRVSWEGRDDHHAPVGPGLYFARLVTGDGQVQVQKLFKIR